MEKKMEDWQLGNESKTKPQERIELMNQWLKKNKEEILKQINKTDDDEKEDIIGFVDL